ncbi:MAG: hypothetical protein L0219_20355, partial [Phycisphaerales bacterium]|nr:hypothetical protein [Phycisphaerales bacterium]
ADLAAEPARSRIRDSIRSMVDARLEISRDPPRSAAATEAAQRVASDQRELWSLAVGQLEGSSEPEKHLLLVQSANDVIDSMGERDSVTQIRVPHSVKYVVLIGIVVAGFLIGFSSGQDKGRVPILWGIVLILMVVVLMMVFDFDTPGRGFVAERYEPLEEVRASIAGSRR